MIDFIKDADCTKETPVRLGVPDAPIYGKGIKLKPRVDGRTDSEHFKKIYLPELLPLEEYDLIVVLISGGKDSVACYLKLLELGVPKERIEFWHHDIDGTLLKDGTLMLDPEYMTVIEKLIAKGIRFVACSGRQFISERKLFAPIRDKLLYITDGGTVVRTPKEILKVHTLPEEIWHGMCETVRNELPDCDYFIATPDYCLAEDAGSRMFRWLTDSYGYDIRDLPIL